MKKARARVRCESCGEPCKLKHRFCTGCGHQVPPLMSMERAAAKSSAGIELLGAWRAADHPAERERLWKSLTAQVTK